MCFDGENLLLDTEKRYRHKVQHASVPFTVAYMVSIFQKDTIIRFKMVAINFRAFY